MHNFVIRNIASALKEAESKAKASRDIVAAIMSAGNPVQQKLYNYKGSNRISVICPRRSGKTFAIVALALKLLESKPNSRFMLVAKNSAMAKKSYWLGAPAGITDQIRLYGLQVTRNDTTLTWVHANGSRGMLVGVDSLDDVEKLRGSQAEVDLCVIDECQSIGPGLLESLIDNVLEPGMASRQDSVLVLAGTPGVIASGPWYRASHPGAVNLRGEYTCISVNNPEPDRQDAYWKRFFWTVADNVATPWAWESMLQIKRQKGWNDANPIWRREYLGEWVLDTSELVYTFARYRDQPDFVTYRGRPDLSVGKWNIIAGLDYGFEDDTAVVVMAYAENQDRVYVLETFKQNHMDFQDVALKLKELDRVYKLQAIIADTSNKQLTEGLKSRFGLPMVYAEKTEKFAYIEMLNSDFQAGRVKIPYGGELDDALSMLQWDLSDGTKHELAAAGKLKEDKRTPNHLCDALLYGWRYCQHNFYVDAPPAPPTVDADLQAAIDQALTLVDDNYDRAYNALASLTQSMLELSNPRRSGSPFGPY